jgi:2-oxoacid:acceptor oxidoreductase gamma subunit (pyruvate/2-ketoisovalerate family)
MSHLPEQDTYEIRWHGRGGQGAVTSSKILADAAFRSGFPSVTGAPTFGAERRGAPVTASNRVSAKPIRVYSQVTEPDIVVVLDDSLVGSANVAGGLRPGGAVIVNTTQPADALGIPSDVRLVTADVTGAALAVDLVVGGSPMVNTAILGSIAAATGLVSMDSVEAAIRSAFPNPKAADKNVEAARIAFDCTHG